MFFHWEVETGSKDKIVTKWELNHEPCESKLRWSHHEQKTMEKYCAWLVHNLGEKLLFPLPCTGTAAMKKGVTKEMMEMAYLIDGAE